MCLFRVVLARRAALCVCRLALARLARVVACRLRRAPRLPLMALVVL